jgi:hypothetical protein
MDKYYIYVNAFWTGFIDKTDANHIDFFEKLFLQTKLKNFEITNDINKANVLFESLFGQSITTLKEWKYKIHYSGEPYKNDTTKYDIVLDSEHNTKNIVDLPLFVYYIYGNNFIDKLIQRPVIHKVPTEFCCFIISNGNCQVRNKMFNLLNSYKKVHSYGKFANNMNGYLKCDYWTDDYLQFIGKYKFIICFENTKKGTYITEKIVNPYLARIIPIYWGTTHVNNIFNKDSMLYLENESQESYLNLINHIIELDNNDAKYIEMVNKPVFNMDYWNEHYTIEKIGEKIDTVIN